MSTMKLEMAHRLRTRRCHTAVQPQFFSRICGVFSKEPETKGASLESGRRTPAGAWVVLAKPSGTRTTTLSSSRCMPFFRCGRWSGREE